MQNVDGCSEMLLYDFPCVFLHLALQLLSKFAQGPNSPMSGVWPTIEYLNRLSTKYFDLVLEYSIVPLKVGKSSTIKPSVIIHLYCAYKL